MSPNDLKDPDEKQMDTLPAMSLYQKFAFRPTTRTCPRFVLPVLRAIPRNVSISSQCGVCKSFRPCKKRDPPTGPGLYVWLSVGEYESSRHLVDSLPPQKTGDVYVLPRTLAN